MVHATQFILRGAGFVVERTWFKPEQIPPPMFTLDELEVMAKAEHGRWVVERLSAGWRYWKKHD